MERGNAVIPTKKLDHHPVKQARAKRQNHRLLFWNIQGLATKASELNEYLSSFSIILLVETFTEERNVKQMEASLPKKFNWFWSFAVREKVRGRPWGGQLIGVAKDIKYSNYWQDIRNCCNGIEVTMNRVKYIITNVYTRYGVRSMKKILNERLENQRDQNHIVLGDWNARVGERGSRVDGGTTTRPSKDIVCNAEGEELLELFSDQGLSILNGNINGDWTGEITHVGYRSQSVIDYGAANESAWQKIKQFRVGDKDQSDHFPLEVTLWSGYEETTERNTPQYIQILNQKNKETYENALKTALSEGEQWSEIAEAMRKATPRRLKKPKKQDKVWWNEECFKARREKEEALLDGRRSGNYQMFSEARKRYKVLIKERKRAYDQMIIDQLSEIKSMSHAWKFINKHRTNTNDINNLPRDDELCQHFAEILDAGVERLIEPRATANHSHSDDGVQITAAEFAAHLGRLKLGKATGPDELKAEAIIYADEGTRKKILALFNTCIQGGPIPEEWRPARIFPLHKKGDPMIASNYRGIALVNCVYKLYANILAQRLTEHIESNNILPDGQNGFRARRSTIDNLYILNTCIQTVLAEGGNLYAFFVDYKAAFDKVNRTKLFEKMRRLEIPKYIIEAIEDIYRETPYIIGKTSIWTKNGLRQGCPLSPILFAIYIYDIEQVLDNWQSGGVRIGPHTIRCLEYADDIVIIAKSPNELKDMIGCLSKYSAKRGMTISSTKSKVMRFGKGGRKSNNKWTCGGENIEEVTSFTYLGFTLQCNGSFNKHIRNLAERGNAQVARVWSIGERKFPGNFLIRKRMYECLVEPTITYGCELFGLEERPELERVMRKYLKWTMGVAPWTKTDLLLDETASTPVFHRTARRSLRFEMRAKTSPCRMLRECVEVNAEPWNRSRDSYLSRLGFSTQTVAEMAGAGVDVTTILMQRHMDQYAQCRRGEVRPQRLPGYLMRGKDYKVVARFRLENATRASQEWRDDRTCRMCHLEDETMDHVLRCSGIGGDVKEILKETGEGREKMRRINQWRGEDVN